MKVFDDQNRLTMDQCAILSKDLQNKSVSDYVLYNMYPTSSCRDDEKLREFTVQNPNIRFRDGFGNVSSCTVDVDSDFRNNSKQTNFREKEQLCTRWHQAVPDYGRGGLIPNVESRLKYNEDSTKWRRCDIVTEKDFNRFIPMIDCLAGTIQKPENLILPFARGGDFTRDYMKSDTYLEKCGFENDGKTWKRKN